MTTLDAQKALNKAIWSGVVDASSMGVFMSGAELNQAIRDFRDASAAEARAAVVAELRAKVVVLFADHFLGCGGYGCSDDRTDDAAAVLTAIDELVKP